MDWVAVDHEKYGLLPPNSTNSKSLVYFCPKCGLISKHIGGLISECNYFYFGCGGWAVAIADFNNQPFPNSATKFIPDQPK